jgi:hypothetical protein
LWWVPESQPPEVVSGYINALERAEQALEADLPKYLPLWKLAVPPEFADRDWDFSTFGRGERFVRRPLSQKDFDEVFNQVARWGLDQHVKDRSIETLSYPAA